MDVENHEEGDARGTEDAPLAPAPDLAAAPPPAPVKRGRGRPKKTQSADGTAPPKAKKAAARAAAKPPAPETPVVEVQDVDGAMAVDEPVTTEVVEETVQVEQVTVMVVHDESLAADEPSESPASDSLTSPVRRRGRPPGSKNGKRKPIKNNSYMTAKRKNALKMYEWEDPIAPARMARPLFQLQGKGNFSIGQHLTHGAAMFKWANDMVRRQAHSMPFPNWMCRGAALLALERDYEFTPYFPSADVSPPITFSYLPPDLIASQSAIAPQSPFSIKRFEAHSKSESKDDFFLFSGGPVQDIAWCPLPWSLDSEIYSAYVPDSDHTFDSQNNDAAVEDAQDLPQEFSLMHSFLAVSSMSSAEIHLEGQYMPGNNLLQIWDMGALNNQGSDSADDFVPFMSVAFVHEQDYIRQMAWCPIATPQPTSEEQLQPVPIPGTEDSVLPRLGLLAAVMGDGSLNIYAIPHPHALHMQIATGPLDRTPLFFKLPPVLTLNSPDKSALCSVAWSHLEGARRLAAGTIDGRTLVWTLSDVPRTLLPCPISFSDSDPELLSSTAPSTETYSSESMAARQQELANDVLGVLERSPPSLPMYMVDPSLIPTFFRKTHQSSTTSMAWHPIEPHILAIGMAQPQVIFWDLRNPGYPLSCVSLAGGMSMDVKFAGPEMESVLVTASDDGTTRIVRPPSFRTIDIHLAPCMTLDFSRLLRLQASGGCDGLVYLTALNEVGGSFATRKLPPGVFIDHIDVESINDIPTLKFAYTTASCANEISPGIEEDIRKPQGRPKKGETREPAEPKKRPDTTKYKSTPAGDTAPLKTPHFKDSNVFINKIRWSPNVRTPSWLAYGTRSGVLRVQLINWTNPIISEDAFSAE